MEIVEAVPQRVSVGYDAYNSRRYSKPWIARIIAWPVGGVPTMESGSYVGDKKGGEVEIMAGPGDIIRDGQRDGRAMRRASASRSMRSGYASTFETARKLFGLVGRRTNPRRFIGI